MGKIDSLNAVIEAVTYSSNKLRLDAFNGYQLKWSSSYTYESYILMNSSISAKFVNFKIQKLYH